jgi:putative transposase
MFSLRKANGYSGFAMLLAQRIALYPTPEQVDYLDRACGSRRHAYNQLLAHFRQPGVKWSKTAAFIHFTKVIRPQFPWYAEVSSRVTRNAIDDLDNAFKHFFRRVKLGQKPGFPRFHKRGVNDGFAMREKPKFDVDGRTLRIEKLATRIRLRQLPRFTGTHCQVTVSKQAGRFYAAILTDTTDYDRKDEDREPAVGVDFGVTSLATLSTGEVVPANQKLKANLRRLRRKQRRLSRKQRGSNRRAKAKLAVAKLHKRIADQRTAVLHEVSDKLTERFDRIVIEDLAVKNMVRNRSLARAISDAGFGTLRRMIEYKAALRGCEVVIAPRFYPSSKTCSECGCIKDALSLGERVYRCEDCDHEQDRDLNAALNLLRLDTFKPDAKRTLEPRQTGGLPAAAVLMA